jgi:hemolysin III
MERVPQPDALKIEFANSLSHGLGLLFGLAGIPVLVATAVVGGNGLATLGASVYGFCFLFVFASSTLYHAVAQEQAKRALRVLDHISIYFQIVGSYTPFVLLYANHARGLWLLGILWALTLLGIVFKIVFRHRFEWLSLLLYVAMGWSLVSLPDSFFERLSGAVWQLIVAGGVAYMAGVAFYVWKDLKYHHTIWHIFVLAGSICHYAAVLLAL